ncbi:MAG: HEAT repeat domain-containing protein [Pirellulales bacterium]
MTRFRLTIYAVCAGVSALLFIETSARAADAPPLEGRFTPRDGFVVEEVVTPGSTGSLVAMAFDESGGMIASRERGPLILVRDTDGDGKFETITTFCDQVKNCQGILPLGQHVFAVGDGPSGPALYRLSDADGDRVAEKVDTLFKFKGGMGEHGPHAPVLGPDGLIYVMIGNHAFVDPPVAATSPHHHYYDAELITPKFEDANGHAAGIKAPGGTVVRTDVNGSFLELFVGGFRNAYDHAFDRYGELFTYDSDMEWDVGLPWYRPTRVNHLIPGAEFGWRSGWSKWPEYFVDSLPATIDIGRGSPTGVVFYDHRRFPEKYQGALFLCDWSQGRIVAVTMQPADGTYKAHSELFLEGRPLNCSDIDVGPDGWLYIAVGGRETAGSIFRVVTRDAAPLPPDAAQGIDRAIRQPQLASAWARRAVHDTKQQLGDQWGPSLQAVAVNGQADAADRVRALDLMQLLGPPPANGLLVQLSHDGDAQVRAKAVYLLGIHTSAASNDRLVELLGDADPLVRRRACEALLRAGHPAPLDVVLRLVAEPRPFVSWAARRTLEQLPVEQWRLTVLNTNDPRVFIVGCVALEVLGVDRTTAGMILAQASGWLDRGLTNDDLVDLLRVIELAVVQGGLKGDEFAGLRSQLAAKFPTDDFRLNRELVRVGVMLDDDTLAPKLVKHLYGKAPMEERVQAAMLARFLTVGWTPELRGQLLDFYGLARALEGGNSYRGYLSNAANDVLKSMPAAEQVARIKAGVKDPAAALGVVQNLSTALTVEQVAALVELDRALAADHSAVARELAKSALLALGHGDSTAADYLGEVFESSPDRRQDAAQALATYSLKKDKRPADWERLVRSLTVVEGPAAREVLRALARFGKKNDKPQDLRQVILKGLKLGDDGGRDAVALLARWSDEKVAEPRTPWQQSLAEWQKWFTTRYPDQPEPVLPVEPQGAKWTFAELVEFLASESGTSGNAERGAVVFEKAQCVKCHRYGARGEGIGPDLSNVASRFQRKEVLESVVFPSQVISDQFAAKTVLTKDGKTYTGMVGPTSDGVVVLQANTEKANVAKDEIEEIVPSRQSAMPDGLFNTLSLEEIADLFAYLAKPATK